MANRAGPPRAGSATIPPQRADFMPAIIRMAVMASIFYIGRYLYQTYLR